jgi:hypothetical protein
MFEHHSQPLLPLYRFVRRFVQNLVIALGIVFGSLGVGIWGYRHYEGMSTVDAFLNASMLLSGMGPIGPHTTVGGKLFAGWYALYSGFVVILASGIVLAPVLHRMLHHFHLHKQHLPAGHPAAIVLPPSQGTA